MSWFGGLGDDRVGVLGPGERSAAVVPGGDEALAGGDEVGDGGEVPLRRAWRVIIKKKKDLDQVESRVRGRAEVQTHARTADQPGERTPGCLWVV